MKDKETAFIQYAEMIEHAWTYAKLTDEQVAKWNDTLHLVNVRKALKGNFEQRWETLNMVWTAFLYGCGYDPISWDKKPDLR